MLQHSGSRTHRHDELSELLASDIEFLVSGRFSDLRQLRRSHQPRELDHVRAEISLEPRAGIRKPIAPGPLTSPAFLEQRCLVFACFRIYLEASETVGDELENDSTDDRETCCSHATTSLARSPIVRFSLTTRVGSCRVGRRSDAAATSTAQPSTDAASANASRRLRRGIGTERGRGRAAKTGGAQPWACS